ncbi:MAG: DUF2807 domain-containing protein [Asgard group archaeon]|nr:DUF2807 domain-containing protein [Asgard group archaeon]
MSSNEIISEKREVRNFNKVVLKEHHEGELYITFGKHESLTIEAPADILKRIESSVDQDTLTIKTTGTVLEKIGDALKTSISRKIIKYHLTAKQLNSLDVNGLIKAEIEPIITKEFFVRFNGAGTIKFKSLDVNLLETKLTNVGNIKLNGKAYEQIVTITGSGKYEAPNLESQVAKIIVKGVGIATLWAIQKLDVTLRGVGKVSYYGNPRIKSNIAPVGSFIHLGAK